MTRVIVKRIFSFMAGSLAVAVLATGANAAVSVVGNLGPALTLSVPSDGTFAFSTPSLAPDGRVLQFQVASNSSVAAAAAQIPLRSIFGITGFGLKLIEDTDGSFGTFNQLDADLVGTGGTFSVSFANLVAGKLYGLLFLGSVTGSAGGFIAGNYAVSAVPLPPAVWLFLSALIGLVGIVRTRRKRSADHAPNEVAVAA